MVQHHALMSVKAVSGTLLFVSSRCQQPALGEEAHSLSFVLTLSPQEAARKVLLLGPPWVVSFFIVTQHFDLAWV